MIYLDNHTTTRPSPAAVAAMRPFLDERWGVATAPHVRGQELLRPMEEALGSIKELIGARESDQLIVTSSGAEAVNHALHAGYMEMARDAGRNHFVAGASDEAPALLALEHLCGLGCEMALAPVNGQGEVTVEAVAEALQPRTGMVTLSWANALTGVIHPVAEIAELCRERGIWFHLDATHCLGKMPFDLDEIAPDFLSFNGDHIHAPVGTGALFVRSGLRPPPLIVGGKEQEGLRGGSVSLPLLVALGVAAREAHERCSQMAMEGARLAAKLKTCGEVLFPGGLPTTVCLAFPGVTSDALLYRLAQQELFASFGGGNYQQLSLQLAAAGVEPPLTECAVSFSLSHETTEGEIDRAVAIIDKTVAELSKMSEALW